MESNPLEAALQFSATPIGFLYYYGVTTLLGGWLGYQMAQRKHERERAHEKDCIWCNEDGHKRYHTGSKKNK